MHLTQETDYAIRIALHLSKKYGEVVESNTLARENRVPRQFSLKILRKLMQAGVVVSHRGKQGGYSLHKKPEHLTLLDVIEAIEGPLVVNRCLYDQDFCNLMGKNDYCPVHHAFADIQLTLRDKLSSVTFASLASPQ